MKTFFFTLFVIANMAIASDCKLDTPIFVGFHHRAITLGELKFDPASALELYPSENNKPIEFDIYPIGMDTTQKYWGGRIAYGWRIVNPHTKSKSRVRTFGFARHYQLGFPSDYFSGGIFETTEGMVYETKTVLTKYSPQRVTNSIRFTEQGGFLTSLEFLADIYRDGTGWNGTLERQETLCLRSARYIGKLSEACYP